MPARERIPNPGAKRHTGGLTRGNDETPLPHETDESHRSQARGTEGQAEVGRKAYDDAIGPAEDTDRGPVLEEVYDRTLAPDRDARPPRQ